MGLAPDSEAPSITPDPIPPAPITTTDSPRRTFESLFIIPNPVVIVSAIRHLSSMGKSFATTVRRFSETTEYSLNVVINPAFTRLCPHL